jgi:proline iminopeptidase
MEGAMPRGIVDCDGFQLEWVRVGMGIPMLIIGGAHFYPQYFPEAMRDHFDMVFCDSRHWVTTPKGFNLSTLTLDMIADDYERVRVATGLERPIVVGHSQHGYHALMYARRYPDRVRGVAVVASSPPSDGNDDDFFERDASPARKAADARIRAAAQAPSRATTSDEFIDRYVAESAYFWFDPEIDRRYLWEGTEANLAVFDRMWDDDMLGGVRLEPSATPTFLALGRYDYGNPYYAWDSFRPLFSNLTYRLYERSAHQPPMEQPDAFTADMVEWARTLV